MACLAPALILAWLFSESIIGREKLTFVCTDVAPVDAAARVAERVNATILPLERSSLMHALSVIISVVKQEVSPITQSSPT